MTFSLSIKTEADLVAECRAAKLAELAAYRWERETGGLALPSGATVATTREAQAQISSTVQSLSGGLITEPIAWKMAAGWADLTAAEIAGVGAAVADHVKRCFAAERAVAEQMAAIEGDLAGFDHVAAFDAAYSGE